LLTCTVNGVSTTLTLRVSHLDFRVIVSKSNVKSKILHKNRMSK